MPKAPAKSPPLILIDLTMSDDEVEQQDGEFRFRDERTFSDIFIPESTWKPPDNPTLGVERPSAEEMLPHSTSRSDPVKDIEDSTGHEKFVRGIKIRDEAPNSISKAATNINFREGPEQISRNAGESEEKAPWCCF
jgi:hypothetical protein